jgi:hypothetical protein
MLKSDANPEGRRADRRVPRDLGIYHQRIRALLAQVRR